MPRRDLLTKDAAGRTATVLKSGVSGQNRRGYSKIGLKKENRSTMGGIASPLTVEKLRRGAKPAA